jgi:hypothetical protein
LFTGRLHRAKIANSGKGKETPDDMLAKYEVIEERGFCESIDRLTQRYPQLFDLKAIFDLNLDAIIQRASDPFGEPRIIHSLRTDTIKELKVNGVPAFDVLFLVDKEKGKVVLVDIRLSK